MGQRKPRGVGTLVIVAVAMIVGCATGGQRRFEGGYEQAQLEDDLFEVSFTGNLPMERQALRQMLLQRAAHMTLEHGFTYFVVIDEHRQLSAGVALRLDRIGPTQQAGQTIVFRCFADDPGPEAIDAEALLEGDGAESNEEPAAPSNLHAL